MAIANFLAEKWSALVELQAQEVSIARRVTGAQYQPDADGTKAIKATRVLTGTIGDYTPGSDITISALSDEQKTIALDQKKYFAFYVDDVDEAQSNADFRDPAIAQHAAALALEADAYTFGLFGDVAIPAGNKLGTLAAPISITDANVDTYIYNMKEILDGQNAGVNRWLVVPSWFNTKLALAGLGIQLGDNKKNELFEEGDIIRYAGFNIVQSNSLTIDVTASGYQIMAYSDRAIPMVAQIQKVTAGDAEKQFAEYVKGLYVFGAEIVFPKEVVVLSAIKG